MISNINELVKSSPESVVEFVHVTRDNPYAACSELVTISIDGNFVTLPKHSLIPGGNIYFDEYGDEQIVTGPWEIRESTLPENLICLKEQMEEVINENVSHGCCGGCI